ncbi:MAG: SDR family oxidoreductase [Rhizobiaceae bacterium]|nr:SDR family oxidoreductase [Rhizobiaceae bacterium]
MSSENFKGKVVLVTGAASGIGRATALRFLGAGADVMLADRDEPGLKEAASLAADAAHARWRLYDAADASASAALVGETVADFGRLDIVVCNAGIYHRAHFRNIGRGDWDRMLAINLTSVFHILQAAIPHLQAHAGNAVTVASTAGIHGIAYAAHYAAAKAGIIALTKSLAVEFGPSGIRFNTVCPGKVKTSIGVGLEPLENQSEGLLVRPPKLAGHADGGEPDDLAAAITWLASDEARYVSGTVLVVDGAQNIG